MSNTAPTMTIGTFMKVGPKMPRRQSILLRGDHGIGKSQVVRKVRDLLQEETGIEYEFIDRRLSQVTEGDIIGLPSTDNEVTRFNPPDWFKSACEKPTILFLDELNRATPEVMQAAFQIVLDYELNGWKLHKDTRCFAAVNTGANYVVNEMDPALLDRFWTIDLKPSVEDWISWAKSDGNIHPVIIEFISHNPKMLDTPENVQPGEVAPSRRTWEKLNNALVSAGLVTDPKHELFYPLSIGFLGTEAAITFHNFVKTYDFRLSGEEIVNRYLKTGQEKFKMLQQMEKNGAVEKAGEYVAENLEELSEVQGKNVRAFMKDLDDELKISLWTKLTSKGADKLKLAKSAHKYLADLIVGAFGVPMGEAGIGVTPNIPDIYKQKSA